MIYILKQFDYTYDDYSVDIETVEHDDKLDMRTLIQEYLKYYPKNHNINLYYFVLWLIEQKGFRPVEVEEYTI